jgi:hypothetical protein
VGIRYTDTATIMTLIEPVILRPLRAEWAALKKELGRTKKDHDKRYKAFRERLGKVRLLDPACGSGNFLYLALIHLKDFDRQVADEARAMGLPDDEILAKLLALNLERAAAQGAAPPAKAAADDGDESDRAAQAIPAKAQRAAKTQKPARN